MIPRALLALAFVATGCGTATTCGESRTAWADGAGARLWLTDGPDGELWVVGAGAGDVVRGTTLPPTVFAYRADATGAPRSVHHVGSDGHLLAVRPAAGGGVVIAASVSGTVEVEGETLAFPEGGAFVVALDATGSLVARSSVRGEGIASAALAADGSLAIVTQGAAERALVIVGPDGTERWRRGLGVVGAVSADVVREPSGTWLAAFGFTGSVTIGGATLTSAGGVDLGLVRFDDAGDVVASSAFGGAGDELHQGFDGDRATLVLEDDGGVLVASSSRGTSDFAGLHVAAPDGAHAFVLALDPDLQTVRWATELADATYRLVGGAAIGPDGTLALVGWRMAGTSAECASDGVVLDTFLPGGAHLATHCFAGGFGLGSAVQGGGAVAISGFGGPVDLGTGAVGEGFVGLLRPACP